MSAPPRVPDAIIDDLRRRLAATRAVPLPSGVGWERGTDADYLAELLEHWRERYDWREHEAGIRALPWVATAHARALHQPAEDPDAPVVVLLHGWPDSVLRFEKVLPRLRDVHVVVPCLPGFPWALPSTEPGWTHDAIADVVAGLMAELGHARYVVSGGDVGAGVADSLAAAQPEHVAALHLTNVPWVRRATVPAAELTREGEPAFAEAAAAWAAEEGAYAHQQSTRPHSLAPALNDSPAGLAAWIVEKLRAWSDCGGDVESVWSRDELLTWVTAYWVTGTIGTSFSTYVESSPPPPDHDTPTAMTVFPHDLVPAPRAFGERFFSIGSWEEHERGGHFGAWEQPDAFVAGLRAALALARPAHTARGSA